MKILVISDSHRERTNVRKAIENTCPDRIFHLGDAQGDLPYIQDIAGENCPIDAVRGNCDDESDLPYDLLVEVEGKKFFLTHGHRYSVSYDPLSLEYKGRELGADAVFYGHTHVPFLSQQSDITIANPGSTAFPRQFPREASYMVLEITPGGDMLFKHMYI